MVKVINTYRDKNTQEVHEIGEELEMTEKRFEEINSTAFGVFVEKIPETPKEPAATAGTNSSEK